MNNLETQNSLELTVQYSDAIVRELVVILPPDDVGEYSVSSIEEFKERFKSHRFIEVKITNRTIDSTELVNSFIEENGKKYEIHRIFETNVSENTAKYITSFLVVK